MVPKPDKNTADQRRAQESVIFATHGSKHVKISFHN